MQTERRTWGRYLLGSLLHTGLETRVVRAQAPDAQAVVLKRSRSEPTHPREAGRLHHEFNTLRDLGPLPGLVQVRGLEEVDGTLALVLEDPGARSLDHVRPSQGGSRSPGVGGG